MAVERGAWRHHGSLDREIGHRLVPLGDSYSAHSRKIEVLVEFAKEMDETGRNRTRREGKARNALPPGTAPSI